jgi:chromosome segregation ATPase
VAQSGNGVDIGTIYQLLTQMSGRLDQLFAVVNDHTRVLNEHTRLLNDHSRVLSEHSRDIADLRAEVSEMRQEVRQYHGAVTSQGIHYSGLEDRMRRIERHLKLEPGE